MRRTPKYQPKVSDDDKVFDDAEKAIAYLKAAVSACHFMGKIKRYVRANFWLLLFSFYGLVFFVVGLFEWITSWGTP